MQEYIASLGNEQVRVDNFVRFSSIYDHVHTHLKGETPFAIKTRRAFNRYTKGADRKFIRAAALATIIATELEPTWNA